MKTRNITFVTISLILLSPVFLPPVGATENLEVIAIENAKTVRMELTTPASVAINVTLYDEAERIYYSDKISAGATFEDEFDFSTVRKGTYRLVSELGNLRYNQIFQVNENAMEFQESFSTFIPQFKLNEDQLMVHFINNFQRTLGISIEDELGHVILPIVFLFPRYIIQFGILDGHPDTFPAMPVVSWFCFV